MSGIGVWFLGHLGADAELRYTDSGMAVLRLRVAVQDRQKVEGEWKDVPIWCSVDVVGKRAESLAKVNLKKGSRVTVRGTLHQRRYERRDGKGWDASLDVRADDVGLVGDRRETSQAAHAPRQAEVETTQARRTPEPVQQGFGNDDAYADGFGANEDIPF